MLAVVIVLAIASGAFLVPVLAASGPPPVRSARAIAASAAATAKPKSILVVGDSVALTLGIGIQRWGKRSGIVVHNEAVLGCTLMDGNLVMNYAGTVRRPSDSCGTRKSWPALLHKYRPDVVITLFGGGDVFNMSWDNGHSWSWAGKPVFDKRYLATMRNASTRLASQGGHVLWLTPPCFAYIKGNTGSTPSSPWYDRRRVAALAKMFHTVATTTHQSVTDVIHTANCPVDFKTRPDGVHFSRAGADAMMPKLGPVILRVLAS
jgi:hypothetical protein